MKKKISTEIYTETSGNHRNKGIRLIALSLIMAMLFMLVSIQVSASENMELTVSISDSSFYLPPTKLDVAPDLASSYGYEVDDPTTVSVVDAIVSAHINLLGDEYTKDNANEYFTITTSGYIEKLLGVETSSLGFFVNGITPNDGVLNPLYGSYTSYTADKSLLNTGDNVQVFFYQDTAYWSDYYAFFDKSSAELKTGEELNLNLSGFMSFFGAYPIEEIESYTEAVSETEILVGTDPNVLEPTGIVTDDDGNASLTFDEAGTYYVSALSYSDEFTYFVLPYCEVVVSDFVAEPTATIEPVATATAEPIATATAEPVATATAEPVATATATTEPTTDTDKTIKSILSKISKGYYDTTEAWEVFDMVCGGYKSKLNNRSDAKQEMTDEAYLSTSIGDLGKYALSLKSLGANLSSLKTTTGETYDIIAKISGFTTDDLTYPTVPVFAILAYDSGDYTVDGNLTRDTLINNILTSRNAVGLWGYSYGGVDYVDYDICGMALNAFAPYYLADSALAANISEENYNEVILAVDNVIEKLSSMQFESGSFANANTDSMIITGLTSIGIDPATDARFIKGENNLITGILTYALDDNSGFGYVNNAEKNEMATEQGFRALIAYQGMVQNNSEYNIYGINPIKADTSTDSSGTGGGGGGSTGGSTDNKISVTVSVVGDKVHGDDEHSGTYPTWIKSTKKSVEKGETVANFLSTVLTENGYEVEGISKGYITSITTPSGETLAEYSNGKYSGWLYTVNGKKPNVGISGYKLSSGDTVKLYYSDDYTKDTTATTNETGSGSTSQGDATPSPTANSETPISTPSPASNDTYNDVNSEHWAYKYINELSDLGILNGDDTGSFRPEDSVTRAEFVAILGRFNKDKIENISNESTFGDVSYDDWFSKYVAWASKSGITYGTSEGIFEPNTFITREDICVMVVRYLELNNPDEDITTDMALEFSDSDLISEYAVDSVMYLVYKNIINGKDNNNFEPQTNATRAEVSKIVSLSLVK